MSSDGILIFKNFSKLPTSITAIDSNNDEFTSSYGRGHFANNLDDTKSEDDTR